LFALLLAMDKGQDWHWTSYPILILLVSSALSLALFVVIELEVENPLLDLRVFTVWPYVNSLLLLGILMVGLFSTLYYIPQFLQGPQRMQALDAGLVMMPAAMVMTVMMPIAGRLYDWIGPRWPAVIGIALTAYGSYLTAHITPDVPRSDLILWTLIRNTGVGLSMMPIMTAGLGALPAAQVSAGSAMNNVVRQVSSSIGLAIFGGSILAQQAQLMTDWGARMHPNNSPAMAAAAQHGASGLLPIYQRLLQNITTTSYANVFLAVTFMCLVGLVLAFLLRSGEPEPAGAPPPASAPGPEQAADRPAERERRGAKPVAASAEVHS